MDIQCREICDKCGGTGKNALSDEAALAQALEQSRRFPGGVLMPGQFGPRPLETRVRELQTCGYCSGGYNTFWLSLNEVLSRGI